MSACTSWGAAGETDETHPLSVSSEQPIANAWGDVLVQLDARRGGYSGDVATASPSVVISLACIGEGTVRVDVVDVGALDHSCGLDHDAGELDSLDVRYVDRVRFDVTASGDVEWALSMAAVPLDG